MCHTCTECRRLRIRCSGKEPCQNCEKNSTDCIYVPRKRKRASQREPNAQTNHENDTVSVASRGEDRRIRRPQGKLGEDHSLTASEAKSVDFRLTQGLIDDPHGWTSETIEAPHEPQSSYLPRSEDVSNLGQDVLPRFTDETQVRWNETATPNNRSVFAGSGLETTAIHDSMFDSFGSWVNWLPFDQVNYLPFDSTTVELTQAIIPPQVQWTQEELQAPQDPEAPLQLPHETADTSPSTRLSQLSQTPENDGGHPVRRRPSQASSTRALYVAGAGARSTRTDGIRRSKRISRTITNSSTDGSPHSSGQLSTHLHELMDEHARLASKDDIPLIISQQNLDKILSKIGVTFTNPIFVPHPFSMDRFPALRTVNYLVHFYVENFHPVYPFLDQSILEVPARCWSLTLATAAIGARYMPSSIADASSEALHGLLHTMLVQEVCYIRTAPRIQWLTDWYFKHDINGQDESITYIQARALNAIGLCHCQQRSLMDIGFKIADTVFAAASRLCLLDEIPDRNHDAPESASACRWTDWRVRESRRRTGFFVWV